MFSSSVRKTFLRMSEKTSPISTFIISLPFSKRPCLFTQTEIHSKVVAMFVTSNRNVTKCVKTFESSNRNIPMLSTLNYSKHSIEVIKKNKAKVAAQTASCCLNS